MRIISGRFGGQQLVGFKADHIRPTTDRMKESLFNKLMNYWEGAKVLDLFSGTGNLGLEALSWGANFTCFVEKNPKSVEIIRENIKKLRVEPELYELRSVDVFAFLQSFKGEPFQVILADPPFGEKLSQELMNILSHSTVWSQESIVVLESSKKDQPEDRYGRLKKYDVRDFGDKVLSFFCVED